MLVKEISDKNREILGAAVFSLASVTRGPPEELSESMIEGLPSAFAIGVLNQYLGISPRQIQSLLSVEFLRISFLFHIFEEFWTPSAATFRSIGFSLSCSSGPANMNIHSVTALIEYDRNARRLLELT